MRMSLSVVQQYSASKRLIIRCIMNHLNNDRRWRRHANVNLLHTHIWIYTVYMFRKCGFSFWNDQGLDACSCTVSLLHGGRGYGWFDFTFLFMTFVVTESHKLNRGQTGSNLIATVMLEWVTDTKFIETNIYYKLWHSVIWTHVHDSQNIKLSTLILVMQRWWDVSQRIVCLRGFLLPPKNYDKHL